MAEQVLDCGHSPSPHYEFTTGYGTDEAGFKSCYECCADHDRDSMIVSGKATLYLTEHGPYQMVYPLDNPKAATVTNWPGTLKFVCGRVHVGRHNIAGKRYDVWFTGPEGATWHGVQYGDNTQIAHCKRVKS